MTILQKEKFGIGDAIFDVEPDNNRVRMTLGKETTECTKMDLWAMVFAIMGPDEQEQIMPVRQTEVMHFEKKHMIQLKRDMKKGEVVMAVCRQSVPVTVVEGLKGMIKENTRAKGIPIIGGI